MAAFLITFLLQVSVVSAKGKACTGRQRDLESHFQGHPCIQYYVKELCQNNFDSIDDINTFINPNAELDMNKIGSWASEAAGFYCCKLMRCESEDDIRHVYIEFNQTLCENPDVKAVFAVATPYINGSEVLSIGFLDAILEYCPNPNWAPAVFDGFAALAKYLHDGTHDIIECYEGENFEETGSVYFLAFGAGDDCEDSGTCWMEHLAMLVGENGPWTREGGTLISWGPPSAITEFNSSSGYWILHPHRGQKWDFHHTNAAVDIAVKCTGHIDEGAIKGWWISHAEEDDWSVLKDNCVSKVSEALALGMKNCEAKREFFATPFTSVKSLAYGAVSLDCEMLDQEKLDDMEKSLRETIPGFLLRKLREVLLKNYADVDL